MAIEAPDLYQSTEKEKAHAEMLWQRYRKKVQTTMRPDERMGIHRVIQCVAIAKYCKPEEAHAKLEHYLKWLVSDDQKAVLDTGKKE